MTKYSHITDRLKREILSGKFERAGCFPSGQALATRFQVSRPTINRVMQDLRNAGLVATHSGARPRLTRYAEHVTGALGVIHPGCQYGTVLSSICDALVRQGERLGWDVAIRQLVETDPKCRLREFVAAIRGFSEERVAGLFFQPFEFSDADESLRRGVLSELAQLPIPIVLLDYDSFGRQGSPPYDLVCMDNVSAGRALGEALLKRGARRLAFLVKAHTPPSVFDRMRGVASAVIDAGLTWSGKDNLLFCEPDERRKIRMFLRGQRPDAIVCGNDATALRLHGTLRDLGVGGRIRLAGFDNQPDARAAGILSVAQPCEEIATIALETLLARQRRPELPVHTVLVPDIGVCM